MKNALSEFFRRMCKKIDANIKEKYDPKLNYTSLSLLISPIINSHMILYNNLIYYYNLKAAEIGAQNAELIIESISDKKVATKAISIIDNTESLFKTSPIVQQTIINRKHEIFHASEKTLASVDGELNDALLNSYLDGEGNRQTAQRLKEKYNTLSTSRAERIAVTEINSAQNEGTFRAYQRNVNLNTEYHQWWTARDNRVRPDHIERQGEIVRVGDYFGNGLQFPGDRSHGKPKDWIWCRCTIVPYILPLGKAAPLFSPFHEDDLVDIPGYERPESVEDALQQKFGNETVISDLDMKYPVKPKGWDKFALSDSDQKYKSYLENLVSNNEENFIQRRQYEEIQKRIRLNELYNKRLAHMATEEDMDELKMLKRELKSYFYYTKSDMYNFDLTLDEKQYFRQLQIKKMGYKKTLTDEENEIYLEFKDKKDFSKLFKEYKHYGLDEEDSLYYVNYYNKYKEKWKLPKIDLNQLTVSQLNNDWKDKELWGHIKNYSDKFKLSEEDALDYDKLKIKKFLNHNELLDADQKRLDDILDKRNWDYFYNLRLQNKGLSYEANKRYLALYDKLKNELDLNEDMLKPLVKVVKPKKIQTITKDTNFLKIKGTTETGDIPGYDFDDLFTVNPRDISGIEQDSVRYWTGNDYRSFRDFWVTCKGDTDKYRKFLSDKKNYSMDDDHYNDLLGDLFHHSNILKNLCNNSTKVPMTFWRMQENPHLGANPKVGDIVSLPGFNSLAVTKDGAKYFAETSQRTFDWTFEIHAPAGTKGFYVSTFSPENNVNNFKKEMEYLTWNTQLKITKYNAKTKHVVLEVIK